MTKTAHSYGARTEFRAGRDLLAALGRDLFRDVLAFRPLPPLALGP
ncbi:hypothetical protein [Streptomyces hoynatensis]|nr:hypothetical protein [Streptomyces hoynatensis]